MKTKKVKISEIKANPENPRVIRDDKFKQLVNSIKKFPKMLEVRPIAVNADMIVLGGNMRLKACKEAGMKEVNIVVLDNFNKQEQEEFIIKDNVAFGEWDWEVLANEWDVEKLDDWGLNVPILDTQNDSFFNESNAKSIDSGESVNKHELNEEYTDKIGKVTYEPKNTNHDPKDLFIKENKFDNEINAIENKDIREMLKLRAAYFSTFNFSKIADYYAYQSNEKEKRIFEKLALVLLDKDQLVENGFSDLINNLNDSDYE